MIIPVSIITKYGVPIMTCVFDTSSNKFTDSNTIFKDRRLPFQDYMSCELSTLSTATVVGKDYKNGNFIVCFGDNFLFSITKDNLLKYYLSNITVTKDGRFLCKDGKLNDLGYLFPDKNIQFIGNLKEIQVSSLGLARKFYARYKSNNCIVKFSKNNGVDLDNELIYFRLAKILGVPCCNIIKSVYNNKDCCISYLHYNINKDCFISFKNTGLSLESIILSLSNKSRIDLDKILLLDYLVNQQDRHMSNIALCNNEIYPTFDNGECFNIGSIGLYSQNFRVYVERLNKNYLKSLLSFDFNKIKSVLDINRFNIFMINYNNLFKV